MTKTEYITNNTVSDLHVVYDHALNLCQIFVGSGRVLDSRLRGCGFEFHRCHCVVSLSKTH